MLTSEARLIFKRSTWVDMLSEMVGVRDYKFVISTTVAGETAGLHCILSVSKKTVRQRTESEVEADDKFVIFVTVEYKLAPLHCNL